MTDLIVVGGGVAGLSAAITAASEGLSVLLVAGQERPGIEASPLIENVPGFTGSGRQFIEKLWSQAMAFGVLYSRRDAERILPTGTTGWEVVGTRSDADTTFTYAAKDLLIATGVKQTTIPNLTPPTDGAKSVAVLGGGNAAGQAALQYAKEGLWVDLFARRPIEQTMSDYLVKRIRKIGQIEVHEGAAVIGCEQDGDGLCVKLDGGEEHTVDGARCCLGGSPNTGLLKDFALLTQEGYVSTYFYNQHQVIIKGDFEKDFPYLYVAGDIRGGSTQPPKRAGFAIGDGVAAIHDLMRNNNERQAEETDD